MDMPEHRDERDLARPGGWSHRTEGPISGPLNYTFQVPAAIEGPPIQLHLVFTQDGLYSPVIMRVPEGDGPFPAVISMHGGSGGLGISFLVDQMLHRSYAFDRFLSEGYVVCYTEGRMEWEWFYGRDDVGILDHKDIISTFRYVQNLPFVDANRVAFFGVSHGGELQMKVISEIHEGPAALVPSEAAVIEFLDLQHDGPRTEKALQYNDPLPDEKVNVPLAMKRLEPISPDLPILVLGRDSDHMQGLFYKLYELLERAGKNVQWKSYDHPRHAYHWGPRKQETIKEFHGTILTLESGYEVDDVTEQTLDDVLAFLNEHVRDKGK
jgi:dienelactone hydrolase